MKDQYVGDIGDYGKFALLRALIANNYSLGVNWYLTPDDPKRENDGKHTGYLRQKFDFLDAGLFLKLKAILYPAGEFCRENRKVSALEGDGILPKTIFFNESLSHKKIDDRSSWVDRSFKKLEAFGQRDIIFLDPDNGFQIKSRKPTEEGGNKYVTYREARQYYEKANVALIIYNHRDHLDKDKYKNRFKFCRLKKKQNASVYRLTFHKGTMRDYIFIVKPKYSKEIDKFLYGFMRHTPDKYFSVGF